MLVVRVIVREEQTQVSHDAQGSMHTPDRTLRLTRNQTRIAALQSEYAQYWASVEDTGEGMGQDTHTDPSISA